MLYKMHNLIAQTGQTQSKPRRGVRLGQCALLYTATRSPCVLYPVPLLPTLPTLLCCNYKNSVIRTQGGVASPALKVKYVLLNRAMSACRALLPGSDSRQCAKKKKHFTSFCQPTRPITCANYGNHVQIFIKSRQSMT